VVDPSVYQILLRPYRSITGYPHTPPIHLLNTTPTSIILADDHAAVRRELRALLAEARDLESDDVLVLDPMAAGKRAAEIIGRIGELSPGTKVVVLLLEDETRKELAAEARRARGGGDETSIALTGREVDVLRMIALGFTNREIAEALYLSVRTIESHRASVQQKLGTSNRAELVRYAIDQGLVDF
jgi:DNA-binding CsgD family transcriptional regulator